MKKILVLLLCFSLISILSGCNLGIKVPKEYSEDAVFEAEENIDIETLKEEYPEYFNLGTFKGVEVYVWSMAEDLIECTALQGTNRNKTDEEILNAAKHSVTLSAMKEILKYNGIPYDKVIVIPYRMPHSSYYYEIDDAYIKKVNKLLKYDIEEVNFSLEVLSLFTKDFFTASFDEYEYFTMVIKNSEWKEVTSDCINNIKIILDGETYYYHSDCGTINDNKNNRSLSLSKDQKDMIDKIIESHFEIVSSDIPLADVIPGEEELIYGEREVDGMIISGDPLAVKGE